MASWLMRCMLRNRNRASLLDPCGIFVLFVDIVHTLCVAAMCVRFTDGSGADVVAGIGSMRVARVICGSAPGVFVKMLRFCCCRYLEVPTAVKA